jgi:Flp pilus assembly protein TadD
MYADLGRQEEAIAAFQRAIELDPNAAAPHNGLGNVYRDLGRQEEAIAAFQRAIELDPTNAISHNGLGEVYRALGRLEEAIAAYERAIVIDPDFAYPYGGLAGVYRRIGNEHQSRRYLTKSRQLTKADDQAAWACLESIAGNVDAALAHLARALERAPGQRAWARRDPDLAFIRDAPRFRELVGDDSAPA